MNCVRSRARENFHGLLVVVDASTTELRTDVWLSVNCCTASLRHLQDEALIGGLCSRILPTLSTYYFGVLA